MDDRSERKSRPNKAPNLLIILLWHHFCYYKHHRILLVATLLMPFILLSVLYILSYEMSSTSSEDRLGRMQKFLPCQSQTRPMMSSGPYHYSNLHDCRNQQFQSFTQGRMCSDTDGHYCQYPSDFCVNETIYVEESLSDRKPYCPLPYRPSPPRQSDCQCDSLSDRNKFYDMCSWMRGYVVYYPNTTKMVEKVMSNVRSQLDFYGHNLHTIQNTPNVDFFSQINQWPVANLQKTAEYTKCFEKSENRVLGFATRQELLQYVKYLNDSSDTSVYYSSYRSSEPSTILWAALNFENVKDDQQAFKYSLMREHTRRTLDYKDRNIHIQDLVESSFVKMILKLDQLPLAPMLKELPSKCWERPNDALYIMISLLLPILCVAGFLFAPMNFLEQVITEKQLKLREYLSIMGVSDLCLKLSWILFYMIFIVPASISAAVYIKYFYGNSMAKTDLSILIVQFILYNLSQLLLTYFLSSFLKESKRVSFILGFVTMLPSMFANCTIFFSGTQLQGVMLIIFRILSLHCSVPFVLSLSYVVNWESKWIGAKWSNFLYSPNLQDGYYGFGEGILWMLGDCILYLMLAWYLQQVMPGDYGVKKKVYFFLQPSYWMPWRFRKDESDWIRQLDKDQLELDLEPRSQDQQDQNRMPTLIIEQLTKFYNQQKMGIDRLSLQVYRNEITALLGQNGAGKSTTINTLVGLLSPTAGRFIVAGLDCTNQMGEIKKLLGFVPQYDILYPNLNVQEHLQFFGWLKGMDKTQIKTTVYPLLDKFGMSHLQKTMTTNLSGGQKRKLSILTPYLGDPQLVILDEPTTGVDPFSRRSIWNILLHHRLSTATIISTHFMDEADLISDRIAVISKGNLRCIGSPMYLKNKYGQGFRVIVACPQNDQEAIKKTKKFFNDEGSGIELSQISGCDLTYTIPNEYARSTKMIDLLKSIEDQRNNIGISSFGISEPTLEEAFFAVADINTMKKGQQENPDITQRPKSTKLRYKNLSGVRLWFNQLLALLRKRAILAWRTPSALAMQIFLPMAFIIILLLASNEMMHSTSAKIMPIHLYQTYRTNVLFYSFRSTNGLDQSNKILEIILNNGLGPRCPNGVDDFQCDKSKSFINTVPSISNWHDILKLTPNICSDCTTYCRDEGVKNGMNWIIPSNDRLYTITSDKVDQWILMANQSDHWVIGGFQYHSYNYTFDSNPNVTKDMGQELQNSTPSSYMILWAKPDLKMAMLNTFYNLLIQMCIIDTKDQSRTVELAFEDIHFPSLADDDPKIINRPNLTNSLVETFLLIFAFTYATFGVAISVQQEKVINIKQLQYVSGCKPSAYWLANFVWDFIQYLLTLAIMIFFLYIFDNELKSNLDKYVNVLIPYGMAAIGFIYMICFRFKSVNAVNIVIIITGILSMAAGIIICQFEFSNYTQRLRCEGENYCPKTQFAWAPIAGYILRIIPYYFLADGCYIISISSMLKPNFYDKDILGKRLIEGYVMAFVWLFLLIIIENGLNGLFSFCSGSAKEKTLGVEGNSNENNPNQDPDVKEEERRILQMEKLEEPVVVKRVTKRYPKTNSPSVDSVTFAIPRSQCFGLLGVNGAGKTSLFRIMTGFQSPTSGQALIEGRNVVREKEILSTNISYCPQENTLFDHLSCREHLRLFASLRGVPHTHTNTMIEELIKEVGLETHAHKLAGQLSGGNKRKLNFALALLDYKPVIFLDEPTSGMDPGARRRTWICIQSAIERGCSVVLTSHSMDECEALCHRLVIMARGKICCIGSVQYLKGKFGNHYTVKIKLTSQANQSISGQNGVSQLKEFITRSIPHSSLIEEHGTMLQYEMGASTNCTKLSNIFGALSECRILFPSIVEDFTLSQVTLERVFVSMAQLQQDQSRNQNEHQNYNQQHNQNQNGHTTIQNEHIQNGHHMVHMVPPVENDECIGVANKVVNEIVGHDNHQLSISHK